VVVVVVVVGAAVVVPRGKAQFRVSGLGFLVFILFFYNERGREKREHKGNG